MNCQVLCISEVFVPISLDWLCTKDANLRQFDLHSLTTKCLRPNPFRIDCGKLNSRIYYFNFSKRPFPPSSRPFHNKMQAQFKNLCKSANLQKQIVATETKKINDTCDRIRGLQCVIAIMYSPTIKTKEWRKKRRKWPQRVLLETHRRPLSGA